MLYHTQRGTLTNLNNRARSVSDVGTRIQEASSKVVTFYCTNWYWTRFICSEVKYLEYAKSKNWIQVREETECIKAKRILTYQSYLIDFQLKALKILVSHVKHDYMTAIILYFTTSLLLFSCIRDQIVEQLWTPCNCRIFIAIKLYMTFSTSVMDVCASKLWHHSDPPPYSTRVFHQSPVQKPPSLAHT